MIPVEASSTSCSEHPSTRAAARPSRRASAKPAAPVRQLAQPLLSRTARARPRRRYCRLSCSGAAVTRFRVKAPAAAAGTVETTSARSGRRLRLMPALMPAATNPSAAVTPPGIRVNFIAR